MKKITFSLLVVFAIGILNSCGEDKPKDPYKNKDSKMIQASDAKEETPTPDPNATVVPPEELKKAKEIIAGASEADIAAVDGKAKYKMFCAACHGFDGKLNINGAKDLSISRISLEEGVAQVYHGRGMMTPFKGILKDAEIIAVANYIRAEIRK